MPKSKGKANIMVPRQRLLKTYDRREVYVPYPNNERGRKYLKKFDAKAISGIFLGCSERSKAYRVYNSETQCVVESMHIKFDDKEPGNETPEQGESFADIQVP